MKLGILRRIKFLRTRLAPEFVDDNGDLSATVLLTGKGRSGTTWMANLINYRKDYRHIFEPFHPEQVELCRHFGPRRYIRPEAEDPRFLEPVDMILRGRIRSRWTDSVNCDNSGGVFDKRLIKTIRAGLFLRWLKANFSQVPIILAIRHPCAVANSLEKQRWQSMLPAIMEQRELIEDHLGPFVDQINAASDVLEQHVFSWCIEYYVIFRQFQAGEIYPLFYEKLWDQPEEEIEGMFRFLGQEYDSRVFKSVRRPSETSSLQSRLTISWSSKVLAKWQNQLTKSQIDRCIEILGIFGLDRIYTDCPMPHETRPTELFAAATSGEKNSGE